MPEYPEGGPWFLFAPCQPYQMIYWTFKVRALFPNIRKTKYDDTQQALFVQFRRPE